MMEAARDLYVKYEGRQHEQITAEMKAAGWPFYRSLLYTTKTTHGTSPGWIERFGWHELLTPEQRRGLRKVHHGRHYFEHWLRTEFPEWRWSWPYQRYIYQRLDAVTKGKCRRLLIFMPPRHGKSEMVTVRYTAWRLMRDAGLNVILGSYNQRLADRFSRKVKRIVQSASFSLSPTNAKERAKARTLNAASEWETAAGGVVRSVGVGAGIAGFGAGLIVIDDPVRNRADAESETYRDRVWEWFNDDIYTRMEPDAAIVLIQTRWHEDDLAGRLLKEMADGGEQWEVISLPALAEEPTGAASIPACHDAKHRNGAGGGGNDAAPGGVASKMLAAPVEGLGRKPGHALCPARFPARTLLKYKKKLGSYSFSALYQQRPSPAEGGSFKRAWFRRIVDHAPLGLRWKRGYDLAISTKTSADYTASFRCAKDAMGNIYIADGFRRRIEYPEQRRYIIERMLTEADTEHGIESALHGRAIVQDIRRDNMSLTKPLRSIHVEKDKLTRALAWLNLAEEGKLILVRGPWIDEFIEEIAAFPTGRHDDQIDAVSIAVAMLSRVGSRVWAF